MWHPTLWFEALAFEQVYRMFSPLLQAAITLQHIPLQQHLDLGPTIAKRDDNFKYLNFPNELYGILRFKKPFGLQIQAWLLS